MHEDIDDFEPDWDAYFSMSDEEKYFRRKYFNLRDRYEDGKITYEEYLRDIDDIDFIGIRSKEDDEVLEKRENERKKIDEDKASWERYRWSIEGRKQADKEAGEKFVLWAFIVVILIFIIIALLGGGTPFDYMK